MADNNKYLKRRDPKDYDRGFSQTRAEGLTKSRILVKKMSSPASEIPAYATLDIVGSRNPITEVQSMGKDINALGYQIGQQQITPSITQEDVINNSGQTWKGIMGGPRSIISINSRNDYLSWKVVGAKLTASNNDWNLAQLAWSSGDNPGKLIPSQDTAGYAKNYLELSRLMRNTQATYLPIANATAHSVTMTVYFEDCNVTFPNGSVQNYSGYSRINNIPCQLMADVLSCGLDDINIYIMFLMADLDWSTQAQELSHCLDILYKSVSLLRQKCWNQRGVIDHMVNYTNRSQIKNVFKLYAQKMMLKTYNSGNFWNKTISDINVTSSKFDGFGHASLTTHLFYPKIIAYEYVLGGTIQKKWSLNTFCNTQIRYKSDYNASEPTSNTMYGYDITCPELLVLTYIRKRDVAGLIKYIDDYTNFLSSQANMLESHYASVDALLMDLSTNLGLTNITFDDSMFKDQTKNYPTLFESIAFSAPLISTAPLVQFNQAVPEGGCTVNSNGVYFENIGSNAGGFLLLGENTNYDPRVGIVMRCPVDRGGNIPTILEKNLAYRNVLIERVNTDLFNMTAAGLTASFLFVMDEDGDLLNLNINPSLSTVHYAQDTQIFVDWLRNTFYNTSFTYLLSGTNLVLRLLNSHVYMDTSINIIPNKEESYNIGIMNNPITKLSIDMLVH